MAGLAVRSPRVAIRALVTVPLFQQKSASLGSRGLRRTAELGRETGGGGEACAWCAGRLGPRGLRG